MPRQVTRFFETLLLIVVVLSVGFGVNWATSNNASASLGPQPPLPGQNNPPLFVNTPAANSTSDLFAGAPSGAPASILPDAVGTLAPAATPAPEITSTPGVAPATQVATPVPFDANIDPNQLDPNDAPLLPQAPGTINMLLLGSDAAADHRYARTDSIIVASINRDIPSVSMLSFPRDLLVRFPDGRQERINTVFEYGYIRNFSGGGPAYLALILRKNFGIKIDHFVRVDFGGFIKTVDTLGSVEVLVECELHETFPDKESPNKRLELDFYPGKMTMNGKTALGYARARYSTTDFDRARRQQKVLRAIFRKAREGNLLQNAINLYGDFRSSIETNLGPTDLLPLIDTARRLDYDSIKSRVITWPIVKSYQRQDGASVLIPTDKTIPFIAESLAPPASNQTQTRPNVEVYNGSSRENMELVAAERLGWEGFQVIGVGKLDGDRFPQTQVIDYRTSPKGSPISRLTGVFRVARQNIIAQPDPSSPSVARIVLGEDYDSCPNTANIAGEVALSPAGNQLIPTPTPAAP
jgi:LCP family protein required for cell wall assembly